MSLLERETPLIRSIYLKEYINHNHVDSQNCLDLITDVNSWRSRYHCERNRLLSYGQDLMFYGILDTTSTATNDVLVKHISAINDTIIPPLVPPVSNKDEPLAKIDFSKFDESSLLQSYYNFEHQNLDVRLLMISKTYVDQMLEIQRQLGGGFDQSEKDYIDEFIYPIINALFDNENFIRKEKRGTVIYEIKTDILFSLMFHDIQISKFSVIEVSGGWNEQDIELFLLNRDEIAKNLKVILNGIFRKNTLGGNHITNVKVYGLQIYNHHFYVYSLQLICPHLYLFKQEMRFAYPLEISHVPGELNSFMENLFAYRSLILSSMYSLLKYLKIQDPEGITDDGNKSAGIQ